MENERLQFLNTFGRILEGVNIDGRSFSGALEDVDVSVHGINVGRMSSPELPTQQQTPPRHRVMLKDLSFELVAPKFGMPLLEAAKQIGVSKSTLHIWCKINGITRWPYRKIRSMEMLISNVQEFASDKLFGENGVAGAIQQLEEEKRAIERNPSLTMKDSTISLMKYITIRAWKKRKFNVNDN